MAAVFTFSFISVFLLAAVTESGC